MAMTIGGGPRKADINVTPMIDVLLVLLIIFMVIVPTKSVGFDARIPQAPDADARATPDLTQLIVTVHADGAVDLNQERVEQADLDTRLRQVYATRGDRVFFLRADAEISFAPVAHLIDAARRAELTQVALMTSE